MRARLSRWIGPSLALSLLATANHGAMGATYHVSRQTAGASDGNPGTEEVPLKSIGAAMRMIEPGDTILVGEGVYREEVVFEGGDWKNPDLHCTLAAAPGAHPVIKGSDIVAGPWEPAGVSLATPPTTPPAIYACPWEPYSMMVFVDGQPLKQIGLQGSPARAEATNGFQYQTQWDGKSASDMRSGAFHYDAEAKRLYVWLADGGDPKEHVVEASVRDQGIELRGTWTVRGLEVRHVQDGFWPREQAVAVSGDGSVIEACRIIDNDFLGCIISGQDCVVRDNVFGRNGLEGLTSNWGYRMLVEGNEFYGNGWRGDVVCLTYGNKFVMWRDSRFIRNRWHDEPAAALWLDISDANVVVAENTFDNCACGVYFEISRWGIIVNNVFRNCGRGAWIYSSDVLVAHNVFDGCGEGITITGFPRTATYSQSVRERPSRDCLMAVRNVLAVNNVLIDCAGAYVGITRSSPHGWGNWSDYNVFVWTLPPYHRTGLHINFLEGWETLYSRLPIWRMQRHCDTHSVVVDPQLLGEVRGGHPYVGLGERDIVEDAGFLDRAGGDYRLAPESALRGRGIAIPAELNSPYTPCNGSEIVTRAWALTRLADAPDPATATPVYGTREDGHYRLQPLPNLHRLVDPDAAGPGTPGINEQWRESGRYPQFRTGGAAESPEPGDWVLLPINLLADPSFDQPFAKPGDPDAGAWVGAGGMHTYSGMACVNLMSNQRSNVLAYQRLGAIRPDAEYLLCGDVMVEARSSDHAGIAGLYLAAGDPGKPIGEPIALRIEPGRGGHWSTHDLHLRTGAAGADPNVGQPLLVVLYARVEGPEGGALADPVVFARWDDLWLLSSP